MRSCDVIVVGSGPAGTFAAYRLKDLDTVVLDVGHQPQSPGDDLKRNLIDLKKEGQARPETLLGPHFESLHNIDHPYLTPKLKAPLLRYVIDRWKQLSPVDCQGFQPLMSFASGGLANSWGAGCYRFLEEDLKGFPLSPSDLDPYYDDLTSQIGISGAQDDLLPYFGSPNGLLPPVTLNRMGEWILNAYRRRRNLFNRNGVFIGYPRIAALTRKHRSRPAYDYEGIEFFKPHVPSLYNPAFTLQELVKEGLSYKRGRLVLRYQETPQGVSVVARNLETGREETFQARKLILCAGALNTARIVLQSAQDFSSKLPLLDNPVTFLPLVVLRLIGSRLDRRSLPLQLNLIYQGSLCEDRVQASIYGMNALLWTDFSFEFPLAARDCIKAVKYLLPAMAALQVFYADRGSADSYLQLKPDGQLALHYRPRSRKGVEGHLIRVFRRAGLLGARRLCQYPAPGNGIHYAGPLPMSADPRSPHETDRHGQLAGSRHVFIGDSAAFPTLPAKNLTFTIMAFAMRVADRVKRELGLA